MSDTPTEGGLPGAEGLLVLSQDECIGCLGNGLNASTEFGRCHICAGTGRRLVPLADVLEPLLTAWVRR